VTGLRNFLFNKKVMKSSVYSFPIINVGNLSMGGTGKTPHVEYLIRLLKDEFKVATLSRGYGRRSQGYVLATKDSTSIDIGDEPLQYQSKFGDDIYVSVDVNRVQGMVHILGEKEDTEVVLLDDAFQHRAIQAGFNILLTTYDKPFFNDFIVPVGNLREARKGKKRAQCIIVTKCPSDLDVATKLAFIQKLKVDVPVYFSHISYGSIIPLHHEEKPLENIYLVSGIANPKPLEAYLKDKYSVEAVTNYKDHHRFTEQDIAKIHEIFDNLAGTNKAIVTTEKDAMRLKDVIDEERLQKYNWCYQEMQVIIDRSEEFNQMIIDYVKETRRDNEVH
jgi:tetraacyldisaccharide 4'-kinase